MSPTWSTRSAPGDAREIPMKTAVVLMQLGGPDRPDAVEPFLRNLFGDPAILAVPGFIRPFLAWLIARRRAATARAIYAQLGGKSPILENTQAQANALEALLNDRPGDETRCFIAMRYWHPMTKETVRQVADFRPDRIVLLPLYPQFSTTTTESSVKLWNEEAKAAGLAMPTVTVPPYPAEPGFIEALAENTRAARDRLQETKRPPLYLLSAHGLPKSIEEKRRDPYPAQVRETSAALAKALGLADGDWITCFQSRVGPVEWIRPYTDECVIDAGLALRPVVVVPIAFVSEHSETLVELDQELREIAWHAQVPSYARAATVGTHPAFIAGLARLVRAAVASNDAPAGGRMASPSATATKPAP
jgi:ferrochelatase